MGGHAPRPLRIALVAGEASGDLLGAGLVRELKKRFPDARFAGIGGPRMLAEGFEAWHESSELAVMGLAEVLRHLPRLLRLRAGLRRRLMDWQPDVFIGIDAPDFNLGLERKLKQAGIRTVHYVSPSVWAWREGRAAKIGRSADRVLCLFPMEPPIYQRHGIDARFVGHPLAEAFDAVPDRRAARERLGLAQDIPVLAVLPGSRQGEIQRLWPTFINAARLVTLQMPGLAVAVPAADPACRAAIEAGLAKSQLANVALYDGQAHDVMVAADVVLLASGTAALEAMLAKRPMVVGYRISALTYRLVMALGMMRVSTYSLPNVLANEPIVPELMQHDCTPENLAESVMLWFRDEDARATLLPRYEHIHAKLRGNADAAAADAVAELLAGP
ncbi:lipid-A-disaccharide synthase [uncultured Arenimonas sp.]|uniref:lipid-A-disaccharide synthase n=1 Tax=uncultured Arenimonas sp. TaxID=546226 RepID=UPI0030DB2F19